VSASTEQLDALIDDYLAGKLRFMHFWTTFMERWAAPGMRETEQTVYAEAYDIVYMGAEGPVAARDATLGLLTEPEVRARLQAFRTRPSGAAPA
jgi:hypothetical protein